LAHRSSRSRGENGSSSSQMARYLSQRRVSGGVAYRFDVVSIVDMRRERA
jgi:hypothetical protein